MRGTADQENVQGRLDAPQHEAWRARFFTIWTVQACSLFGSQLVQFALIWHLTVTTNSAVTLSVAALMGALPQVVLSPVIGTLVDRWNRRMIMIMADGAIALATLALALLFAFERAAIWHVYVLLFVRAVGGGFHQSAMGASVVLLVPRIHLARVQGLNQALRGSLEIVAAPLGALLLQWLPLHGVLAIDVGTAVLAIAPLLVLSIPQPPRTTSASSPSLWGEMGVGVRYILGWPGLSIVLAMAALINFVLAPTAALLPLLVTRHFGGGVLELGWINAANGAGFVLGGVVLGMWGGFRRRVITAMLGLIGLGLATVVTGLAPAGVFWLAVAATLVGGITQPITNGSLGAVIQATVAADMQGRVFALVLSVASGMAPLGLALAGPLADRVGVQFCFVLGGIICAAMGVLGLLTPAVVHLETQAVVGSQ